MFQMHVSVIDAIQLQLFIVGVFFFVTELAKVKNSNFVCLLFLFIFFLFIAYGN